MKTRHKHISGLKSQRGATIVVVALILPILIGMAALAVDIGYVFATRNELQNIADAAALAATGELGNIYSEMSYEEQQAYVCDPSPIVAIAQEIAGKNQAARKSITINDSDVIIGTWDIDENGNGSLTPTYNQPDAVRVIARRDSAANEAIITFFAGIFKLFGAEDPEIISVRAVATAALTGQSTGEPGELELPVGISVSKFTGEPDSWCGQIIKFSPVTDPDACAGWNVFTYGPSNDDKIRDILEGDPDLESPFVEAGETEFDFINGNLSANTFEALMTLFQEKGVDVDGIYDPDNPSSIPQPVDSDAERVPLCEDDGQIVDCRDLDSWPLQLRYPPCAGGSGNCSGELRFAHEWETTVSVYDSDECNPSGDITIAGFVDVIVYDVGQPSDKTIEARIRCDYVEPEPTRGGGVNFGKKGSIPGLVQ